MHIKRFKIKNGRLASRELVVNTNSKLKSKKILSVVVPCMGRRDHLEKTINSVLGRDIEYILVDYSCPQNSGKLAAQYGANVVSITGQTVFNLSKARNAGAKKASADWLCFLDVDLILDKGFLSIINNNLVDNDFLLLDREGHGYSGFMVVKKSDFLAVGGYNEGIEGWGFEDYELRSKLIISGLSLRRISSSGVHHIDHSDDDRVKNYVNKDLHASNSNNAYSVIESITNNHAMAFSSLTYLSFEIINKCNLSGEHAKCPINDLNRYVKSTSIVPPTDDQIASFAIRAYREHGFRKMVAFHYYNEPLLDKDRMLSIIDKIRVSVPNAKFCLWTNGLLIPRDINKTLFLNLFCEIRISNYYAKNTEFFNGLRRVYPQISISDFTGNNNSLDNRRAPNDQYTAGHNNNCGPCFRPFHELIIDYFGNLRLCCVDYQNLNKVANIIEDSHEAVLDRWAASRSKALHMGDSTEALSAAGPVCQRCTITTNYLRQPNLDLFFD